MVIRPKYTPAGHKLKIKADPPIIIRPEPTRDRPQVGHKTRPKTNTFMSRLESLMTSGTPSSGIQQMGKKSPISTVKSSRSGVIDIINKLSFLV